MFLFISQPVDIPIGSVIEVLIKDVRDYGFMAELAPGVLVLLHNKQLGHDFVSLRNSTIVLASYL